MDTKFCARGQFNEKWFADVMSETATDTKIPMMPKDGLEAWAVQYIFVIQHISDLYAMAEI